MLLVKSGRGSSAGYEFVYVALLLHIIELILKSCLGGKVIAKVRYQTYDRYPNREVLTGTPLLVGLLEIYGGFYVRVA